MSIAIRSIFLFLSLFLFVACGRDSGDVSDKRDDNSLEESPKRIYGKVGDFDVAKPWEESLYKNSVLYYPLEISKDMPLPVIFFAPGWKSVDHKTYETLLKFIASHGYIVIYAKDDTGAYSAKHLIQYFKEMLDNSYIKPYIDSSRIGVIGHSSGGGAAFKILQEFSVNGWGENGRFLLALEPWFAFDMNRDDMKNLPSNSNILFIQFGKGGENHENGTDARIPLSEYYLLSSIDSSQKDYQIFENADHTYPTGAKNFSEMQGILKPLDALMEYTFEEEKTLQAHYIALEGGDDDPYNNGNGIQHVKGTDMYHYRCDGDDNSGAIRTLVQKDIDYCAILR